MKQKEKYSYDRTYFYCRWAQNKYRRPCDWTIVGLHVCWSGPKELQFKLCFFGFEMSIWIKRYFIGGVALDQLSPDLVVRMHPTTRSHTKQPYYAMITLVSPNGFSITIPGRDTRHHYDADTVQYHLNHMEIIGPYRENKSLLYNQDIR